jgi:hypothetical protein
MDFKRQHILLFCSLLIITTGVFAQAKKPTIMILPSDNWCMQRYFMTEFENQGTKQNVPDYKAAFQEDTELGQVISKIGGLMADQGFPLKDAEQELKILEQRAAEDNMTMSSSSAASLNESPLDMLKKRAKADIILQLWWKVNKEGDKKSVSFTLDALDSYTGKRIASATGNGEPSNEIVAELLMKAVQANMSEFVGRLDSYFSDLLTNGREVTIFIKTWDTWGYDLEEEFDGEFLQDIIDNWMADNTVSGRYSLTDATETFMRFEQVRIPLYDDKGRSIDSRKFTNELRKYLMKEPYVIESKLMTRGLGEAILVLGEK